jgi:broad specificity phosphatase PhoE
MNDIGRKQAAITADFLASNGPVFTAIYASDLSRAFVTAQFIAKRTGGLIIADRRLREIDLGEWQGLTDAEVHDWDGERLAEVRRDRVNAVRPGGESWRQVGQRAVAMLVDAAHQHTGGEVLAVSHGGTIRAILYELQLLEVDAKHIDNCSRTILRHQDDGWALEAYNLTDHLKNAEAHHWEEDNFSRF